ncbi:hypothetical protein [Candidatus Schmidhempelia bombi]|jgi:predicted metal-dependent HD superfamily phosphohydrolase|uniref:hypothetical protein n=1 Tax=Candidatus Schmidhempelia bombi TaxID=1505866 RepID=UPI0004B9A7E5|nr:hypothetical protein [Candidatus Schmidhempelia bombi]
MRDITVLVIIAIHQQVYINLTYDSDKQRIDLITWFVDVIYTINLSLIKLAV